jgi:hypothetical protein
MPRNSFEQKLTQIVRRGAQADTDSFSGRADATRNRRVMKGIRRKTRIVGPTLLLVGGVVGYSLALGGTAHASVSNAAVTDGAASTHSLAEIGGPPANLENAGDWATCLDANSNDYPNNGDKIRDQGKQEARALGRSAGSRDDRRLGMKCPRDADTVNSCDHRKK